MLLSPSQHICLYPTQHSDQFYSRNAPYINADFKLFVQLLRKALLDFRFLFNRAVQRSRLLLGEFLIQFDLSHQVSILDVTTYQITYLHEIGSHIDHCIRIISFKAHEMAEVAGQISCVLLQENHVPLVVLQLHIDVFFLSFYLLAPSTPISYHNETNATAYPEMLVTILEKKLYPGTDDT